MRSSGKTDEKMRVFNWLGVDPRLRVPGTAKAMIEGIGVSPLTFYRWKKEFDSNTTKIKKPSMEIAHVPRVQGVQESSNVTVPETNIGSLPISEAAFDDTTFYKSREEKVARVLMEKIEGGRANAKEVELYYKLIGKLVPEDKDKGNKVDDNRAININFLFAEAQRELEREGHPTQGTNQVQTIGTILPRALLSNTGQGADAQSAVPVVGLPETVTPDDSSE